MLPEPSTSTSKTEPWDELVELISTAPSDVDHASTGESERITTINVAIITLTKRLWLTCFKRLARVFNLCLLDVFRIRIVAIIVMVSGTTICVGRKEQIFGLVRLSYDR